MNDMKDITNLIKKAAIGAMEEKSPINIKYGTVISDDPLKIQIDQKLTLSEIQLELTSNVINYTTNIIIDGETKSITIKNELTLNDKVILLRMQGGQQYLVLDKVR